MFQLDDVQFEQVLVGEAVGDYTIINVEEYKTIYGNAIACMLVSDERQMMLVLKNPVGSSSDDVKKIIVEELKNMIDHKNE